MLRLYNNDTASPADLEWAEIFSYAARVNGIEENMTLFPVLDEPRMYIHSDTSGISCHVDFAGTALDLYVLVIPSIEAEIHIPAELHINLSEPDSIGKLGAFLRKFVSMRRDESLVG